MAIDFIADEKKPRKNLDFVPETPADREPADFLRPAPAIFSPQWDSSLGPEPSDDETLLGILADNPAIKLTPEGGFRGTTTLGKIAAGAGNIAGGAGEFFLSPAGPMALASGALPGITARTLPISAKYAPAVERFLLKALGAGYSATMVPGAAQKAGIASVTHDPQDVTEAVLGGALAAAPAVPALIPTKIDFKPEPSTPQDYATETRLQPPNDVLQHQGIPQGADISTYPEQVREGQGQRAGGGGGVQPEAQIQTAGQAQALGKQDSNLAKGVLVEANDHPVVAETHPELLPEIAKDELKLDKDAYKGESAPNPTPSAKELLTMTPDEVVTWKRATLYGPDSAAKIAEKMDASDIPKLEEQRDLLREKASLELSQVEGPEDVAQLNKANTTSLKAQTLNEIVDAAKAKISPAESTEQPKTGPTTQAQSAPIAPESGGGIQKYKIGTSPQTYSLQERLAQSAEEKANNEQPVRVRNDRTGEEQTVLESDLKPVQTIPAFAKAPKRDLDAELRAVKLDPSVFPTKASKEAALKRKKALSQSEPAMSRGPGAAARGEPGTYGGLQQLVDQLESTTPEKPGLKQRTAKFILQQKQGLADLWAEGKSTTAKAIGRLIGIGQSIKETARGVREPTDMDRKVSELDFALQKSSAKSKQAGRVLKKQIPSKADRDALAIWVDAGGREDVIRDATGKLPDKTKPAIRSAVEIASNLPDHLKQHAELVRQYFGMRENDAKANEIFEKGLQDYFTHIWKKEDNMPASVKEFINGGRVNTYFQFARQRKIPTLLEGILQGKEPVLDPAEVIPYYNYLLDRAIASRRFIKEASDLTAKDGRPALAPTGIASKVEKGTTDEAMIIKPRAKGEQTADYRQVDHPALRKWKWAGTDEAGRPTFYQSDLLVHPDFYERIARFMDRGRLTPTKTGKALLRAGSEVKGMKLGLLSLFHQVHVGSHALWHWTNPFHVRAIDWEASETKFAIEQGHLKLAPDPSEIVHFSEGIVSRGLVQKIPIIGPWSRAYSEWFFGEYIPKLKLATFKNALGRNRRAYAGKLTDEEIAARVGDAVNNAYGELNQLFLGRAGRDPRFQRLLRGIFLAPDFGEGRLRFVEKAFTRYGHEERLALATMFLTMYTAARIGNWASHGDPEWELKRAFMVKSGQHWWTMRSVLGDLVHAVSDFGNFMRVRLSPLYGRTALELLAGRDQSGLKRGYGEQAIDVAKQFVPIQLGSLTRDDQKFWESFISSLGVSAIRDTPEQDMHKLVAEWKSKSANPKLQAEIERAQKETLAPSDYRNLRLYLQWDDEVKARQELERLRQSKSESTIIQALRPNKPFTGSWKYEHDFLKSLTPPQRETYEQAKVVRKQIFDRYLKIRSAQTPP